MGLRRWARALAASPQARFGLRPRVLGVPPRRKILAALFVTLKAAFIGTSCQHLRLAPVSSLGRCACALAQASRGPAPPARLPAPSGYALLCPSLRSGSAPGRGAFFRSLRSPGKRPAAFRFGRAVVVRGSAPFSPLAATAAGLRGDAGLSPRSSLRSGRRTAWHSAPLRAMRSPRYLPLARGRFGRSAPFSGLRPVLLSLSASPLLESSSLPNAVFQTPFDTLSDTNAAAQLPALMQRF